MANIAYYIKRKISGTKKAAIMQTTDYRYITTQNITNTNLLDSTHITKDYLGTTITSPIYCNRDSTLMDVDYYTLDLNTEYTCNADELFVGGKFEFCSNNYCKVNQIFSTPSVINKYWSGLLFRKHNDALNNYLIYYSTNALNIINTYNTSSNQNLMFTNCSCPDLCKLSSCIFYVKYIDDSTLYATAPNGYLYYIKKDSNGYFYVDNIYRTNNYYINGNPLDGIQDHRMLKMYGTDNQIRELMPAYAIDSVDGITFYSISNRLIRIFSNNNISFIYYNPNSVLDRLDKYIQFITDICVIPNGTKADVLATIAILSTQNGLYSVVGVAIILFKQYTPTLYDRELVYLENGDFNFNNVDLSEDFVLFKNAIRIQKIDSTNFYVTIGYDLYSNQIFTRENSLMQIEYDYNTRTASVIKTACPTTMLGIGTVCWADSNKEILFPENTPAYTANNIDLNYYLLDNSGQCISETLNTTILNTDNNTSELVWNDIIGASVNTSLYKLVKCDDNSIVIYPNAISNITDDLIGKVVNIYGHYKCCFIVLRNDNCNFETINTEYVLVTNVYDGCRECNGIELNNVRYDLKYLSYQPSLNIGTCDVEKYVFTKCKFAEAVYKKYLEEYYKIKVCCNEEYDKWWIKGMLIEMLSREMDVCNNNIECNKLCVTNMEIANIVVLENVVSGNVYIPTEGPTIPSDGRN